ncbi:hypothetical protein BPTFM16_02993 [Altererythrobacter insulae]|nr:hypothetical protein BPTFM16_02993 [Altererythrobacter insulae]
MVQALKKVPRLKLVALVMVMVRCKCVKAYLRYNKLVLLVVVKVKLLPISVLHVVVKAVLKKRKHYLLKFLRALIPAIEFVCQAKVKRVSMAHQPVIYMCK